MVNEAKLQIRYCELEIAKWYPCIVGFIKKDKQGVTSCCQDEPREENCRYLIDNIDDVAKLRIDIYGKN